MTTDDIEKFERSDEFDLRRKHNGNNPDDLIPIVYFDNSPGKVRPEDLDDLIQKRLIISFHRSNEWVRVKGDPIRERVGNYEGPERRRK
jgi:hypothetical protein